MAMIKTGDTQKIETLIKDDEIMFCDKCGKKLNTLQITEDYNEPICECEVDDE